MANSGIVGHINREASSQFNVITASDPIRSLPVTLEQRTSGTSMAFSIGFIALAAAVLLTPFALLAIRATVDPATFFVTLQQPVIALQLGLALLVAVAFVAVPLRLLLRRSMQPRNILISQQTVSANDRSGNKIADWSEPLAAYQGVAHHIRSSLSGAQHEIVLVHRQRSKSVVLQVADRIGQPQIDAMAALLNVAQVPARVMYEREGIVLQQPAVQQAA